jgi:4-hydroxy-2-oxovalerate aldolase
MSKVDVLDCTIRDGSYAVDYQFTIRDVAEIGKSLEGAGFRLIEIGHGVGLYGAEQGLGAMAQTDEEYCRAAAQIFQRADWGMFFIPGIGRKEDLDMAAGHGMKFCRIGCNIDEIETAKEYFKHAKSLGLFVCSNLMKSYAVSGEAFAGYAAVAEGHGADAVYLVDSAGGMFPDDVRAYVRAAKERVGIPIGFHGHDNLCLAMANTVAAIEEGAVYVDSSLQGLGRSAGNTQTEPLVMILERLGYETGIDGLETLRIGERLVRPMMRGGRDELAVICGAAQFHSSFLPIIRRAAERHEVDARRLIIELTKQDKLQAPETLVEELAKQIAASREGRSDPRDGGVPDVDRSGSPFARLGKEIHAHARKHDKRSVIAMGFGPESRIPPMREGRDIVIGSVEVASLEDVDRVVAETEGKADALLLDAGGALGGVVELERYWKRGLIPYDDQETLSSSLTTFLLQTVASDGKRIAVVGANNESAKLTFRLHALGFELVLWDEDRGLADRLAESLRSMLSRGSGVVAATSLFEAVEGSDVLISMTADLDLDERALSALKSSRLVIEGMRGALSSALIAEARRLGIETCRFDTRTGLAAVARSALETRALIAQDLGEHPMDGYSIVAGGVIGAAGDIVVDSISRPARIIGIADGRGGLLESPPAGCEERLAEVERWILDKRLD